MRRKARRGGRRWGGRATKLVSAPQGPSFNMDSIWAAGSGWPGCNWLRQLRQGGGATQRSGGPRGRLGRPVAALLAHSSSRHPLNIRLQRTSGACAGSQRRAGTQCTSRQQAARRAAQRRPTSSRRLRGRPRPAPLALWTARAGGPLHAHPCRTVPLRPLPPRRCPDPRHRPQSRPFRPSQPPCSQRLELAHPGRGAAGPLALPSRPAPAGQAEVSIGRGSLPLHVRRAQLRSARHLPPQLRPFGERRAAAARLRAIRLRRHACLHVHAHAACTHHATSTVPSGTALTHNHTSQGVPRLPKGT